MGWKVFGGALALLTLTGWSTAAGAVAFDCWKLDEGKLAEARQRGLCGDGFGQPTPPASAAPPARAERTVAKGPPHGTGRNGRPGTASLDLGERFTRDARAVGRKLDELFSGRGSGQGRAPEVDHSYPLP